MSVCVCMCGGGGGGGGESKHNEKFAVESTMNDIIMT